MEPLLQSPWALFAAAAAAAAAAVFILFHALPWLRAAPPRRTPVLHSIGTATPPRSLLGSEFLEIVKSLSYPEAMQGKMERLVAGSGITRRFCVSPAPVAEYVATMCGEGARGALWDTCVPQLAVAAARDALARWRHGSAQDITHVVVHSCTGFSAPGLDFEIIRALGLRSSTRKVGVNFMGCFGGMTSLYVAKQLIEADDTGRAVVLVACAEACSVHVCKDPKMELAIGNSIFGDGAGAAIVTHAGFRGAPAPAAAPAAAAASATTPAYALESDSHEWSLGPMSSEIVPDSAGHMTWKQSSESGRYDMWLDRGIPEALMGFFKANSAAMLWRVGLNPLTCAWALHPGGKGILNAFEGALKAMGFTPSGLDASHSVLDNYGNMSSATIFFVLQRVLSSTARDSTFVAAFGPGLTVEFGALFRLKTKTAGA